MSAQTWIRVSERLPQVEEAVWYFFEDVGVHAGTYHGVEWGLPTFGGRGTLAGDVTHWMPRADGDARPAVPVGYTYPERCLVHGATLPYDHPDVCHTGNRETTPVPATDWAHAAARGVFCCLDDQHEIRLTLRQLPDESHAGLVAVMADGFRRAQRQALLPDAAVQQALADLVAQPVARTLLSEWPEDTRSQAEVHMAQVFLVALAHAGRYAVDGWVKFD
jgi:hypothetical protein